MSAGWATIVAFAAVAGAAGLAGVWLMWRHERRARRRTSELITFASGLLVGGSLLHILPRAGELTGPVAGGGWALAAFVLLYAAENHVLPHPHSRTDVQPGSPAAGHPAAGSAEASVEPATARVTAGPAAILGLALHSVLDGIAVGAGLSADLLTGGVMVGLVVSHKLPVGIASMGILYHTGLSRAVAARTSAAVALVTPVAAVVAYALLRDAAPPVLGALVGGAGGAFLYVGAADLLPEGQAAGIGRNTLVFLAGVALVVAILLLVPHG